MKKIVPLTLVLLYVSVSLFVESTKPAEASDIIYIRSDGNINPATANITTLDNITYRFTGHNYDGIVVEKDDIILDGAGYALQGNGSGSGIYLASRSNVTIRNLEIKSFISGIFLFSSSTNNTISGNNITDNVNYGIYLSSSSNNTISGNNITNNAYALFLYSSNGNSVYDNDIINNEYGIWIIGYSSNNLLCNNELDSNRYGFYVMGYQLSHYLHSIDTSNLVDGKPVYYLIDQQDLTIDYSTHSQIGFLALINSTRITIKGLTLTNNYQGLLLAYTNNSKVTNNQIASNGYGVWGYSITNNTFYHNAFLNNTKQAYIYGSGFANAWDNGYPSGGNYWEDYLSTDLFSCRLQNETGNDGIGDEPYGIQEYNVDNYPLMGEFSDFNVTSEHHLQTICNSTITNFRFNGTAISFNVTGESGTTGFCRIFIPTVLMNDTYRVFVNATEVSSVLLPFSNATYSYVYFTYDHSTQEVTIIPEFPARTLQLILLVLAVAVTITKRRLLKTLTH